MLPCWLASSSDFNPRSPWGERQAALYRGGDTDEISIHAPRGGSDLALRVSNSFSFSFQSTLPVGGATRWSLSFSCPLSFQSTLPVGGATSLPPPTLITILYFNPRSPWGERHLATKAFSTRDKFQSTLPVGGATPFSFGSRWFTCISIHAPRGGSDFCSYP